MFVTFKQTWRLLPVNNVVKILSIFLWVTYRRRQIFISRSKHVTLNIQGPHPHRSARGVEKPWWCKSITNMSGQDKMLQKPRKVKKMRMSSADNGSKFSNFHNILLKFKFSSSYLDQYKKKKKKALQWVLASLFAQLPLNSKTIVSN